MLAGDARFEYFFYDTSFICIEYIYFLFNKFSKITFFVNSYLSRGQQLNFLHKYMRTMLQSWCSPPSRPTYQSILVSSHRNLNELKLPSTIYFFQAMRCRPFSTLLGVVYLRHNLSYIKLHHVEWICLQVHSSKSPSIRGINSFALSIAYPIVTRLKTFLRKLFLSYNRHNIWIYCVV